MSSNKSKPLPSFPVQNPKLSKKKKKKIQKTKQNKKSIDFLKYHQLHTKQKTVCICIERLADHFSRGKNGDIANILEHKVKSYLHTYHLISKEISPMLLTQKHYDPIVLIYCFFNFHY